MTNSRRSYISSPNKKEDLKGFFSITSLSKLHSQTKQNKPQGSSELFVCMFSLSRRTQDYRLRYGYIKNHKKTIKNGQAQTRESEEYKAEARKVKSSHSGQTKSTQKDKSLKYFTLVP
ncbi:hypothetical protein Tco_1356021 [Tanacetum coccineum]